MDSVLRSTLANHDEIKEAFELSMAKWQVKSIDLFPTFTLFEEEEKLRDSSLKNMLCLITVLQRQTTPKVLNLWRIGII